MVFGSWSAGGGKLASLSFDRSTPQSGGLDVLCFLALSCVVWFFDAGSDIVEELQRAGDPGMHGFYGDGGEVEKSSGECMKI